MRDNKKRQSEVFLVLAGLTLSLTAGLLVSCSQQNACANCSFAGLASTQSVSSSSFAFSPVAAVEQNLGANISIPLVINGGATYSGNVSLSIARSELNAVDLGQVVGLTITPAQVAVSPGHPGMASVTLNVDTRSPSTSTVFHVVASDSTGNSSTLDVPLKIDATYDIKMMGGSVSGTTGEVWSSPNLVYFASHKEGITVRFINYDKAATHIVHSSGPIPHGDTNNPLAMATASAPGGIYSTTVTDQTAELSDVYYCHTHEGGNFARTLVFNHAVTAVATPTPVADANAKYSYISANILAGKCVTCHNSANAAGGVNLADYAHVTGFLVAGNASISVLYSVIKTPGNTMPLGGTPLSATDQQAIADWINAGALNN